MFFSLNQIFNSKISTSTADGNETKLTESFEELSEIAVQSDFIPVEIALQESFLRKSLKLNQNITDDVLNNISALANKQVENHPKLIRNLFTSLGISYQRIGKTNKALFYKHKALNLANKEAADYPSFLINIGGSHFYNKELDSAKYYLKKGYFKITDDPKTVYAATTKATTAFNLSVLYKRLNDTDSAYYFSRENNKYTNRRFRIKLKQNRLYADKKFEVQKAKLHLANKEIELHDEKQKRNLVFIGFSVSLLFLLLLVIIYRRTIKLKREAEQINHRRERLLQIVNHDLGEPLQVFIDSSIIIPKLIATKRYAELKVIQESLSDTLISLQSILKNLFSWNKKNSVDKAEVISEIDIKEQLEIILKSYEPVAAMKGLSFDFESIDKIVLKTNAFELGNLLRNIIYNAVKHSPADNTIYLKARLNAQKHLEFTCLNAIKKSAIENIIELIDHFNGVNNLNYSKTGLGLELIDEALKRLDAKIEAKQFESSLKIKLIVPQS